MSVSGPGKDFPDVQSLGSQQGIHQLAHRSVPTAAPRIEIGMSKNFASCVCRCRRKARNLERRQIVNVVTHEADFSEVDARRPGKLTQSAFFGLTGVRVLLQLPLYE